MKEGDKELGKIDSLNWTQYDANLDRTLAEMARKAHRDVIVPLE